MEEIGINSRAMWHIGHLRGKGNFGTYELNRIFYRLLKDSGSSEAHPWGTGPGGCRGPARRRSRPSALP